MRAIRGASLRKASITLMQRHLGPLELDVMHRVWARETTTVKGVREELYEDRKLAYTTVATAFRQVEKKGFLSHQRSGRKYVYTPTTDREEVSRCMLTHLVGSVFKGSPSALVETLVHTDEVTEDELERIREIVDAQSESAARHRAACCALGAPA